jgi:acetoin utilization protein AcuB
MLVSDLMTPNPVTVLPGVSVAAAAETMEKRGIRHLPVVDERGALVGLVTRPTLARALPGTGTHLTRFEYNYLMASTQVGEVMISEPACIAPDSAAEEAARIMNAKRISSLLVVHEGQLNGIITDTDIFGALLVLMGARRPGVRLTVHILDRAGQMAKVTSAIAERGGNLSAVGGWYLKDRPEIYGAILKVENLTKEQAVAAISNLADVRVVDVRGEEVFHQQNVAR